LFVVMMHHFLEEEANTAIDENEDLAIPTWNFTKTASNKLMGQNSFAPPHPHPPNKQSSNLGPLPNYVWEGEGGYAPTWMIHVDIFFVIVRCKLYETLISKKMQ
jgi:hypothetical protein